MQEPQEIGTAPEQRREDAPFEQILKKHSETRSGARLSFENGIFLIKSPLSPLREIPISEDELIAWYEKKFNISFERFKERGLTKDRESYRKEALEEAKHWKGREFTGGIGVSARSLEELEEEFPSVTEILRNAQGKVIFLGNGLSDVPLIVAEKYSRNEISEPPVIVDMFDYELLYADLTEIKEECEIHGFTPPLTFEDYFGKLDRLVSAIRKGKIVAVNYYFGSERIPAALKQASLAINWHGPIPETIWEQLSILSPGGRLYTDYLPPKYYTRLSSLGYTTRGVEGRKGDCRGIEITKTKR